MEIQHNQVLHCPVLCYTVLYSTVLYCIALYLITQPPLFQQNRLASSGSSRLLCCPRGGKGQLKKNICLVGAFSVQFIRESTLIF